MPNCPNCATPMTAAEPPNPPWVCDPCARGFWNAELTDSAIALWRPAFRDYGDSLSSVALLDQIAAEAEQAGA